MSRNISRNKGIGLYDIFCRILPAARHSRVPRREIKIDVSILHSALTFIVFNAFREIYRGKEIRARIIFWQALMRKRGNSFKWK